MARGYEWWGSAPLMVGASGLLLLAFGAKWMPGDEIDNRARAEAEKIVDGVRAGDPAARVAAAEILQKAEKTPAGGDASEANALRTVPCATGCTGIDLPRPQRRDRRGIAFYGGLVLVFAAGVLLYCRAPESNRAT